eukprot:31169-Pelagococcus_subviridis.AAC.5
MHDGVHAADHARTRDQRERYLVREQLVASQVSDPKLQARNAVAASHDAHGGPHDVPARGLKLRHDRGQHDEVHADAQHLLRDRDEVPERRHRDDVPRAHRHDVRGREPKRELELLGVVPARVLEIVVHVHEVESRRDDAAEEYRDGVRRGREREAEVPGPFEDEEVEVRRGEARGRAAVRGGRGFRLRRVNIAPRGGGGGRRGRGAAR